MIAKSKRRLAEELADERVKNSELKRRVTELASKLQDAHEIGSKALNRSILKASTTLSNRKFESENLKRKLKHSRFETRQERERSASLEEELRELKAAHRELKARNKAILDQVSSETLKRIDERDARIVNLKERVKELEEKLREAVAQRDALTMDVRRHQERNSEMRRHIEKIADSAPRALVKGTEEAEKYIENLCDARSSIEEALYFFGWERSRPSPRQ